MRIYTHDSHALIFSSQPFSFCEVYINIAMSSQRKKQPLFVIIVFCFAFLALILIVTGIAINQGSIARLKKTIARLESEGFYTDPHKIMTQCPDSENAALPLQEALSKFQKPAHIPLIHVKGVDGFSSLTLEKQQDLRQVVSNNLTILPYIQQAASRPSFVPLLDYDKPITEWYHPDLDKTYEMLWAMTILRGSIALVDGHRQEALECCLLGLKCLHKQFPCPTFTVFIKTLNLQSQTLKLCQEAASGIDLSEDITKELIHFSDPRYLEEEFPAFLDLNRMEAYDYGARLLEGQNILSPQATKWEVLSTKIRPIVRNDVAYIQEQFVEMIKAASEPYWKSKNTFVKIMNDAAYLSKFHVLPYWTLHHYYEHLINMTCTVARSHVTRLALACKLYARKNGSFPKSLSELAPVYIETVPLDPFTGKPFIYRLLPEGGFVLYSVGLNEKDDCVPFSPEEIKKAVQGTDQTSDDIIWLEMPREKSPHFHP